MPKRNKSIEQQIKESYKNSTLVFIGEVKEITKKTEKIFVTVKFSVGKTWNKDFPKEITISTGQGSGDCGFEFEIGKRYLVYAYGQENNLKTNICTRTDSSNLK